VIPNSDGAGIVDQIGDGVTRFAVRRPCLAVQRQRNGRAFGTAAEYITLADYLVTPLPEDVSFAAGATLGISRHDGMVQPFRRRPDRRPDRIGNRRRRRGRALRGATGEMGWRPRHRDRQFAGQGYGSPPRRRRPRRHYRTEDVVAKVMAFTRKTRRRPRDRCRFRGNIATTLKLMAMNSTIAVYATNGNRTP